MIKINTDNLKELAETMDLIAQHQLDKASQIYYCVVKSVNNNQCTIVFNNKQYTVPYYGGKPTPNKTYAIFLPHNNMNESFVIGDGKDGGTEGKIVPISEGGTGANNAADARANLGLGDVAIENVVPLNKGGTGATTAAQAAKNLNVLPLGEVVTKIPSGADLNDYVLPGVYAIGLGDTAATIANIPSQFAGTLRVFASIGAEITASSAWKYLIQEYVTYTGARYQRNGRSGSGTAVTWGAWETVHPITLAALNGVSKSAVDLSNGEDLNNYLTSGFYYIRTGVTNAPRDWTWLIVCNGPGTMQMCVAVNTIYVRCYTGSPLAWTNWRSVALS